jgi:hypothetical protein
MNIDNMDICTSMDKCFGQIMSTFRGCESHDFCICHYSVTLPPSKNKKSKSLFLFFETTSRKSEWSRACPGPVPGLPRDRANNKVGKGKRREGKEGRNATKESHGQQWLQFVLLIAHGEG